jgi:hypothetical protein
MQTTLINERTLADNTGNTILKSMYKHTGFQMTALLEGSVSHSLCTRMHGFHPTSLSLIPQTCDTINLTLFYHYVASEYD